MNMRKVLLVLILLSCLFVACTERRKSGEEPFREYAIQGTLYEEPEIFAIFPKMISMDSLLLVYSYEPMISGKFVTIYSPREGMKEIATYGTQGRGPGEYLYLEVNSTHDNRFFARNTNMKEFIVCEVRTDSGRVEVREVERLKFEPVMYDNTAYEDRTMSYLDDRHYVAVSYGGPGKFFSLYNDRMNWLAHFGDGPVVEEVEQSNARHYLEGYLSTKEGAFVYAPMRLPQISFYSQNGDVPQKEWEDTFYDSYYRVNNKRIEFDNTRTVGVVRDVELGEKYVYVLFLDIPLAETDAYQIEKSSANIIFVYDHKGNRVARLNLDYRIDNLCVSTDENTLYGITQTPGYHIAVFDLPRFEE